MCSYCGCDAEAVIAGLMADHAVIADLVYRIDRALEAGHLPVLDVLTGRLAEEFARHSAEEEAGLFAQLLAAGEAVAEVEALISDHRHLRPALDEQALAQDPKRLRSLLTELTRHAETEDNDLFPYAVQQLPNKHWAVLGSLPAS